jgi:hypothetical protein
MYRPTITEEYRELQKKLHGNPNYGTASLSFAPIVAQLIRQASVTSVSDYGAGKQNLLKGLQQSGAPPVQYLPYDPAFPEYGEPSPADLVCCIDVLEHIEPDLIDNVLDELRRITVKLGFYTIHMGPAAKILADGRNAHLIQRPSSWWLQRLSTRFDVLQLQTHNTMGAGFWTIVKPIG